MSNQQRPVCRGARSEGEVDAAYELAARVFGPSYFEAAAVKRHNRRLEPLAALDDAVVAVDGEQVVGLVRLVDRQMHSPAGLLQVGGVTSVCIHPDYRGQGLGIALMEAALDRQFARGDELSVLFARRAVDGWYPRLGYLGIASHANLEILGLPATAAWPGHFAGELRNELNPAWRDGWAAAYDRTYGVLPGAFRRPPGWWDDLTGRLKNRVQPGDFLTVLGGRKPVGYLARQGRKIVEAATVAGQDATLLAALAQVGGSPPWALTLPPGHDLMPALRRANHTMAIRFSWDGGHMVRPLCRRALELVPSATPVTGDLDFRDHVVAREALAARIGLTAADSFQPCAALLPCWSPLDEL